MGFRKNDIFNLVEEERDYKRKETPEKLRNTTNPIEMKKTEMKPFSKQTTTAGFVGGMEKTSHTGSHYTYDEKNTGDTSVTM